MAQKQQLSPAQHLSTTSIKIRIETNLGIDGYNTLVLDLSTTSIKIRIETWYMELYSGNFYYLSTTSIKIRIETNYDKKRNQEGGEFKYNFH